MRWQRKRASLLLAARSQDRSAVEEPVNGVSPVLLWCHAKVRSSARKIRVKFCCRSCMAYQSGSVAGRFHEFLPPTIWGFDLMNHKIIAVSCAIALSVAGISTAQAKGGPGLGLSNVAGNFVSASSATPRPAGAVPVCVSVAGMTGNGDWGSGDPNNSVIEINIGAGNEMTGAAADAAITAFSPSWLSEATVTFSSTTASDPNAINLTMSITDASGTEETTTGGVLLFADYALPNIPVNADGILRLEFNEAFDDGSVNPDSQWNDAAAPTTCQGIYLTCTNQAACDAAVGGGGGTPLGETQELPTLNQWAMGLLALGLGWLAFRSRKRLFSVR